jgi:hypothetical protein
MRTKGHGVSFLFIREILILIAGKVLLKNILLYPETHLSRMPSSGMWRRVAPVRTDVSQERSASIIRVKGIRELRRTLAVTRNWSTMRRFTGNVYPSSLILFTLMMWAMSSTESSFLTRATQCHISEDSILHSPHLENLKSFFYSVALSPRANYTDWATKPQILHSINRLGSVAEK